MIDLSVDRIALVLSPFSPKNTHLRDFIRASAAQTRLVMGSLLRPAQASCGGTGCAGNDCANGCMANIRASTRTR